MTHRSRGSYRTSVDSDSQQLEPGEKIIIIILYIDNNNNKHMEVTPDIHTQAGADSMGGSPGVRHPKNWKILFNKHILCIMVKL